LESSIVVQVPTGRRPTFPILCDIKYLLRRHKRDLTVCNELPAGSPQEQAIVLWI